MKKTIRQLNTPQKVQDFLDKVPFNFERRGETYMSPSRMLRENRAHCFEGALFACLCLQRAGIKNFLMDFKVKDVNKDNDHVICAFQMNGYWGAISKTNHSVLRWRDPIYRNFRELAMSYFHEYFLDNGEKTLASFSRPFNVWRRFGESWLQREDDLDEIAEALDKSEHLQFVPRENKRFLRRAGKTEIKGAAVIEHKKPR